jgi:superfamily II DNA or RNA helicase
MCRILDGGQTFGTNKAAYLSEYFDSDYMGYNLTLKAFADASIMAKIRPLVHLVSDNKLDTLPALREEVVRFKMPDETREVYDDMKRHMVAGDVEAANEAVKSGKLRQLASGFLYQENRDEEVDVLDTSRQSEVYMWRALHPRGTRLVIFYEFMEQGRALTGMFQNWATSSVPDFVGGKANILLAQIHSLSHGVDGLQHVCADVLFMQPVWSRDAAEQAVGRVWRQGQTKPVTVTTLVCDDTLDDVVMQRVEGNAQWMGLFKQHLKG